MDINKINVRTWSILGQRGTLGDVIAKLAEKNDKIVALSADLCNTSGLDRFKERYSNRFINVGIAEQNMIGVAAGLSDEGFIPFATTFANFATMRSCEFVRHFMGYMNSNIKLVGLSAGFAMEYFGNTHYGVEDIATIRAIPNITIISPADGLETAKCVEAAVEHDGPVYIRLTGTMNTPIIYKENFDYKIGRAIEICDDGEVVIIANGTLLSNAIYVGEELGKRGIKTAVIDMHTIKPIDENVLNKYLEKKLFVTIEEHCIVGGLGSAISEFLMDRHSSAKLLRIGTKNAYSPAGQYSYKIKEMGLDVDNIVSAIIRSIK